MIVLSLRKVRGLILFFPFYLRPETRIALMACVNLPETVRPFGLIRSGGTWERVAERCSRPHLGSLAGLPDLR